MAKPCSACKIPKELSEFHKDKQRKDGLNPRCKACSKTRNAKLYKENKEHINKINAKYRKTKAGKESFKKTKNKQIEKYPNADKARREFRVQVNNGNIRNPGYCSKCPSAKNIQGHHDDYSKPLDVRWLCIKCHRLWHKTNTPLNRK